MPMAVMNEGWTYNCNTLSFLKHIFYPYQGLTTLLIMMALTSCGDEPLAIPDPPSFDWQESIYTNPVPIAEVTEPECDIMPPLDGPEPPFNGYYYYYTSPDPVIWKIKLNKSRRDMIAYISYVPDLESDKQERTGHYTISIKDLILGDVTVVDEMPQGYHLGFDFAGDYLIYEQGYGGFLFNWKTAETEELSPIVDYPSLSTDGKIASYWKGGVNGRRIHVIHDLLDNTILFSQDQQWAQTDIVWLNNATILAAPNSDSLIKMNVSIDTKYHFYLGPFDLGQGLLVGLSTDGTYLYGNNQSISNLNTLKVNGFWHSKAIGGCGNRDLENFFILPDNTFMMRKTYYISDHEKRIVHPEYHWHLFDANGSNERRVDLQL